MLLELEAEGVINIVRLKDRFCTVPSSGGWRDLMVNVTLVGDELAHICELQVVHENMLTAREGLPGHAVYNRVRNAAELLGLKFGGAGTASDAVTLASVLVGMGGGDAVGKEGGEESRDSRSYFSVGSVSVHRDHISGKDVFLADKGWLSDAPLNEWLGVRVDESSGRVTHVELKGKGLVGSIPTVLANLTALQYLDMRTNDKIRRPAGLEPSEAHPTGELRLLDMTGQLHYTTKERCQAFLQFLKLSAKGQRAKVTDALLVSKHGPDGPALRKFFDANGRFPHMQTGRWFQEEEDVSEWGGVVAAEKKSNQDGDTNDALVETNDALVVVGLKLNPYKEFKVDGLVDLNHLSSLELIGHNLTSLPSEIGQLTNLALLALKGGRRLKSLPSSIGQLKNLTTLHLVECNWRALPPSIGQLTNLTLLDLCFCTYLTSLPPSIGQLVNLATLDLRGCTVLTALPSEIGLLANLATLNLTTCTALTSLPDLSHLLPTLKVATDYTGAIQRLTSPCIVTTWVEKRCKRMCWEPQPRDQPSWDQDVQ